MKAADDALYCAKREGRGRVVMAAASVMADATSAVETVTRAARDEDLAEH